MKYYTIHYKQWDYKVLRDGYWHGYAESAETAEAALRADPTEGKNIKEIVSILEQGFDVGDRVVTSGHEIVDDEPGVVIDYASDGWIIVYWEQFKYGEEFHWTELKKVIE
jgi:hypothetical protein